MNQKRTIGVIAVMLAVLVIAAPMYIFLRVPLAGALDDCKSLETLKSEKIHEAEKRYLEQEIATCNGVDIDKLGVAIGTEKASEQVGKQPEATPTPSATPSSTSTQPPAEVTKSRQWEYLANRAPNTKSSHNAFGPLDGLAINKRLDNRSITADEAVAELRHRLTIDPMLTAATGAAFELWSYGEVDAKTKVFAEDHSAWDKANAEIEKILDTADAKIVELHGQYTASWAVPGAVPSVMTDLDVWRDGQLALVINGKTFQIQCGFQQYWKQEQEGQSAAPKESKAMPKPSPGMTRTDEGTPVKEKPKPDKPKEFTPPKESTPPTQPPTTPPTAPPTTTPPTQPPTTPPTTTPPTTPPTTTPPTTPPSKKPKSSNPDDYKHKPEKPKATKEPAQEKPKPVATKQPGGGGVVDTPTRAPGSETGVTAPGADPAPTKTHEPPPPAPGANNPEPDDNSCVPAPGKSEC